MKFGVLIFPGTWSHQDFGHVFQDVLKVDWGYVWHKNTSVAGYDCLILPGGFAHGDYLRCGAIARFSPIMDAVIQFARDGGPIMGSCNGFQILCEAGLLPGALLRNDSLQYRCRWDHIRADSTETPFTRAVRKGQALKIPISHGEGRYSADPGTLARLRANDQVIFRYSTPDGAITDEANPNGALENIAGICNEGRNILGLMPHPERASETLLGSEDGRILFESVLASVLRR